jgi:hypothetical protein
MTDLFGQRAPTKICRICKVEKPLSEYYRAAGARDGHRNDCRSCNLARRAEQYRANPRPAIERERRWRVENADRYRERMARYREDGKKSVSDRKSHLKRKYGLTLEDFDRMLADQGGGCAICGKNDVDNVDHDHSTGSVRGILCFRCNAAIGQLDDEPERARDLAAYLERDDELATLARSRAAALTSA